MLEDDNTTKTVELIKRIDQKKDSPGINKEKGMAYAHTDTDVKNQLSNNIETTQKPRKQDNPKYSSALSQRKQQ